MGEGKVKPMLGACHESSCTMTVIQDGKKFFSTDLHAHFFSRNVLNKTVYKSIGGLLYMVILYLQFSYFRNI